MFQKSLPLAFIGLVLADSASASVYMLNFGNGGSAANVPTTEAEQKNSPYHIENPSFTGTTWNNLLLADATGITDATGVGPTLSVNLGIASNATGSTLVNLATNPSASSALTGAAFSTGVYADNSVGRYGILCNSSGNKFTTNHQAVGVQISGLAAGVYEIYTLTRNTNTSTAQSFSVYVGTSASTGNFDFAGYANESISMSTGANTAWVDGANYLKQTVTIGENEALNIAVDGTVGQSRGFLNAIQIVQVPEPSSLLLLAPAIAGLAFRRKRA